jgi:hypothetical protein
MCCDAQNAVRIPTPTRYHSFIVYLQGRTISESVPIHSPILILVVTMEREF